MMNKLIEFKFLKRSRYNLSIDRFHLFERLIQNRIEKLLN